MIAATTTVNEKATAFMTEMVSQCGARFEVTADDGWIYKAAPNLAGATRAFVRATDKTRPGFRAAVVAEIRRREAAAWRCRV